MSVFDGSHRASSSDAESSETYPSLRTFFGAYMNQDYDLFGDTPEEVTQAYRDRNNPDVVQGLIGDLRRFLAAHESDSDEQFRVTFRRCFKPDISFEDWKQQTLREFLRDQLAILDAPRGEALERV